MKSLEEQIQLYNVYHTTCHTKFTHVIATPCLVIAVLILLNWLSIDFAGFWEISFSWLLAVGVLLYYFFLNWKIGTVAALICLPIIFALTMLVGTTPNTVTVVISLVLFVIGIIMVYIGHKYEASRAKFPVNFYHFLVEPLFLIIDLLNELGLKKYFL